MDILTYINRMNQIYGGEPVPVRYNTQQYLQGPRSGYQGGQLVDHGPGRQGYSGKGGSDPTYRANLLENLPEGYLEDYKANFYNTIKDGKLTHRGGAQPPSVKGSLKKGIPFMMDKYGMKHGKIADTNSALKASFQSQIESGAKMGYQLRIEQLRAVAPWNPKAPPGMETHHFLPKLGIEGTDINFASTRNTAFVSKELNRKMSPIDKKLKKIQLEQIELLENKPKDWRTKIETLNERARGIYKNAAKEIPGSAGYLGFSEIKVKPDGTYTVEVRGIDYNKSLSGINEADEIFYRDPKTFEPISRENKLKVNEMSNIKSNKIIPTTIKGMKAPVSGNVLSKLIKSPGAKKAGRIAAWTLGPLDFILEAGMALPALAKGNPRMAKRSTTPGVFGSYGGTMLEDIKEYSPSAYRYAKAVNDVNRANELVAIMKRNQKIMESAVTGSRDELSAKQEMKEAAKEYKLLEKNFKPIKESDLEDFEKSMMTMAKDSRARSGDKNWLGQERGEQFTQESLEASGVNPIAAQKMMEKADTTEKWRREAQLKELDYELGGLDVEAFLGKKQVASPMKLEAKYGKEAMKKYYEDQSKFNVMNKENIDPGVSFKGGGKVEYDDSLPDIFEEDK